MATTWTLQNSINFAQSFGGFKQLSIGTAGEPAVTSANIVLTTILSPPFCWNWNRGSASFVTSPGVQDYAVSVPAFGFIEKGSYIAAGLITNTALASGVATYTVGTAFNPATTSFVVGATVTVVGTTNGAGVFNIFQQVITSVSTTTFTVAIASSDVSSAADTGTATVGKAAEITNVQNVLAIGNEAGSPVFIAPQIDNNAGTITFRVLPVPDQPYQITVIYQNRIPALMTGTSSLWAPIPDHYILTYTWGFLAVVCAYFEDPRWAQFSQKFVSSVLGMAEGLDEQDKDVFQKTWLDMVSEQQSKSMMVQQGRQAKGV